MKQKRATTVDVYTFIKKNLNTQKSTEYTSYLKIYNISEV